MSFWEEQEIENKITEVLRTIADAAPEHHFGPPFLTAYQLAIEFANRYPDVSEGLGFPIGGEGIGQRNSLAQYLAKELSRRINGGQITHVEGGFLSNQHLTAIDFNNGPDTIRSSLTDSGFTLSMFRLRD